MNSKPFGWGVSLLLLAAVVALAIIPLLLVRDSEFGGADGQAEEAISAVAPDYQPWFAPVVEPPGGETESLLFALQAALGAGLIGYFFGLKRGQRAGQRLEHPIDAAPRRPAPERT